MAANTCGLIVQIVRVVTVHNLDSTFVGSRWISKDGLYVRIRCSCRVDPATLHITVASISHATTRERTSYTKVIDILTEMANQRTRCSFCRYQTADSMSVAVNCALEALIGIIGYRRPRACKSNIAINDEVDIPTVFDRRQFAIRTSLGMCFVEESGQLLQFDVITDINLRVTVMVMGLHGFVQVHIIILGCDGASSIDVENLVHAVVVGHWQRHGIRVTLAEIRQGVVGHVMTVLIPVQWGTTAAERCSVLVGVGRILIWEDLPSATEQLVGTLRYGGLVQIDHITW